MRRQQQKAPCSSPVSTASLLWFILQSNHMIFKDYKLDDFVASPSSWNWPLTSYACRRCPVWLDIAPRALHNLVPPHSCFHLLTLHPSHPCFWPPLQPRRSWTRFNLFSITHSPSLSGCVFICGSDQMSPSQRSPSWISHPQLTVIWLSLFSWRHFPTSAMLVFTQKFICWSSWVCGPWE